MNVKIQIKNLLQKANYQIEFSKLAAALVHCYEEMNVGRLNIIELRKEKLVTLLAETELEAQRFNEMIMTFLKIDEEINGENPLLLIDVPFFDSDYSHHLCYPLHVNDEPIFILVFSFLSELEVMEAMKTYGKWIYEILPLLQTGYFHEKYVHKSQRRDILLQVMKKFHETVHSEEVLAEIVRVIEDAYPTFRVSLSLSQEWGADGKLLIEPFIYGTERGNATIERAYLTGEIQIDHTLGNTTIFAPLCGKQGVYGVMEIETNGRIPLPDYEIDFIKMLADTGGMALENTEMYKQTRNLIHDCS